MSSQTASVALQAWIHALNGRQWDAAQDVLSPIVKINGTGRLREEYLSQLQDEASAVPDNKTDVDMVVVNTGGQLAARLIHTATLVEPYNGANVTGKQVQWAEFTFYWFQGAKITRIESVIDVDGLREGVAKVDATPVFPPDKTPGQAVKAQFYSDYIDSINTLTMQQHFDKYCHPNVTHNLQRFTVDEYRLMIESSFESIKGLHFNIEELVADDETERIAARLRFTGTPVKPFVGIEPTGKQVVFHEHVYYQLHEGRILWVWSVLDLDAYRSCLA